MKKTIDLAELRELSVIGGADTPQPEGRGWIKVTMTTIAVSLLSIAQIFSIEC